MSRAHYNLEAGRNVNRAVPKGFRRPSAWQLGPTALGAVASLSFGSPGLSVVGAVLGTRGGQCRDQALQLSSPFVCLSGETARLTGTKEYQTTIYHGIGRKKTNASEAAGCFRGRS